MKNTLIMGAMLLALSAAPTMAAASPCAAPEGLWGPFKPLATSQKVLATRGSLKIVALGSSSTFGTGATSPDHAYPAQLASILQKRFPDVRIEVINAGIGGETVDKNLARLDRDVLAKKPDLVIWQVGTNDAFQKKSIADVYQGVLNGIARIKKTGADVVLMEAQYFPSRPDTDALKAARAMVRKAAIETHVDFLPRYTLMRYWIETGEFTPRTLLIADRIHMTDASYHCLARRVADLLPAPDAVADGGMVAVTNNRDDNKANGAVVAH
jgi:lysophospholipase L1-like esterase